jgi:hypothetical protein
VLELISTGAALPDVLDKICTALDVQMGNAMSLVLFLDDDEHFTHTMAQNAAKCGLFLFSCTAILSPSDELLGTFEIYSCFPRGPTRNENMLIERATYLAALAIQLYAFFDPRIAMTIYVAIPAYFALVGMSGNRGAAPLAE